MFQHDMHTTTQSNVHKDMYDPVWYKMTYLMNGVKTVRHSISSNITV